MSGSKTTGLVRWLCSMVRWRTNEVHPCVIWQWTVIFADNCTSSCRNTKRHTKFDLSVRSHPPSLAIKISSSVTMATSRPGTMLLAQHTYLIWVHNRNKGDTGAKRETENRRGSMKRWITGEWGQAREKEEWFCCSSSVLLYSTFFTAIFIFYVGGSDTALRFCCRSTSDLKQHFDTEWEMCTCGGSRWGSHADHLTWFVNNDIRIAEHWRRALLAVDRGGGGGCARKRGVAWGGDRRACQEKVVRLLDE